MEFAAQTEGIAGSSMVENSLASSMQAAAAANAAQLTAVLPMGNTPADAEFAAALNARGGLYLAAHGLQALNRNAFAGGQALTGATIEAVEVINTATSTI